MDTTIHKESKRGFTIAEVTMAVGIVAFGLVAVFSILPFGLTAQKDNREETIIRYEAEYWFSALQAGGLNLESMDRVERVELNASDGASYSIYSINRHDLRPTDLGNTNDVALAKAARNGWPVDVCGWLSAPDYTWINGSKVDRVPSKYARVWAINGPVFDRLYSPRDNIGHFLPGGEFSFGYFLETHVEPQNPSGTLITLTLHWPITGPIEDALNSGSTIHDIMEDPDLRPPSQKSFPPLSNTSLRVQPALTPENLNPIHRRFMGAGQPGEQVTAADMKAIFPSRKSWEPFDGGIVNPGGVFPYKRMAFIEDDNKFVDADGEDVIRIPIKVRFPVAPHNYIFANIWETDAAPLLLNGTLEGPLQPSFISENEGGRVTSDEGLWLRIKNSFGQSIAEVQIKRVEDDHQIICSQPNTPEGEYAYEVSFLRTGETWENVFRSYGRKGLGDYFTDIYTGQAKWRFGAIYKSFALGMLRKPGAISQFSIALNLEEYGFEDTPTTNRVCSFWFLR